MKRPRIRNVARYGFYGFCAAGVASLAGGIIALTGIDLSMAQNFGGLIGVISFLVLRDMDTNADVRAVERSSVEFREKHPPGVFLSDGSGKAVEQTSRQERIADVFFTTDSK